MSKAIVILSVLVVAAGLILSIYNQYLTSLLSYVLNNASNTGGLFTPEQLQQYDGVHKPQLYISILGNVFDVTKGSKHYGPGETYNVFVGCDASRSFITGKFDGEEVTDDVTGLSQQDLKSLSNWLQFYKREYTKVGKLIGRYYDTSGKPTQYYKEIKKKIKLADKEKENEDITKSKFPPCNVEWSADHGSRVWCTRRSGGIERSWVGVPRKFYEPGSDSHRCACVKEEDRDLGNIKEYEDCNPNFDSCFVKT